METRTVRHVGTAAIIVALAIAVAPAWPEAGGVAQSPTRFDPRQPLPPDELPPHLAYLPLDVAGRMLELAGVTRGDLVYDLGCGDGRIAIAAAKTYGARGVCVDDDPKRIAEASANAQREGVANFVRFVQERAVDLSDATVVTMSTPQSARWLGFNGLLHPNLTRQLRPGARIVTNFVAGSMLEWKPDLVDRFTDARGTARAVLYLWLVGGSAKR
ncbi:MAG: methyltransferase domain-containing protein [Acidobacteriota bacterium]